MTAAGKFVRRTIKASLGALTLAGLCATQVHAQTTSTQAPYLLPYTIQTLAGGGTTTTVGAACAGAPGFTSFDTVGDGCPITSSSVVIGSGTDVHDVGVDQQGNVFFLDNATQGTVRRIDARTGVITIYAGSFVTQTQCAATSDYYGDGCPANDGKANAAGGATGELGKSRGIAVAPNGDVYIADYTNSLVHKISAATGLFSLVAGYETGGSVAKPTGYKGSKGYTGDGSNAVGAAINATRGVAVDAAGNIYIADTGNSVIRKVNTSGIISTIAGSTAVNAGFSGDGGPATQALLSAPEDVQADSFGNVYFADFANNRVRMIYAGGTQAARLIALTNPGTTASAGYIYTIMGGGTGTYTAGTTVVATSVPVAGVRKIALDTRGNVYLDDNTNDVIWFLDVTTGQMRVLAGETAVATAGTYCAGKSDAFGDNCPATQATFNPTSASGVDVDAFGQLYITDTGDGRVRKVLTNQAFPAVTNGNSLTQTLEVHFAAGDGPAGTPYTVTGAADFTVAAGACTVNADTTQDCLVNLTYKPSVPGRESANLKIASLLNGTGVIGIEGAGTAPSVAFDPGTTASFASALKTPGAIAQDGAGNIYIADTGNNRVLRYTAAGGTGTIVAGSASGAPGFTGDGAAATASTLNAPRAVAVSRNGALYIADTGNNVIRRVDPVTGLIATVAGNGTACSTADDSFGDGCPGTSSKFAAPAGLAADSDGNVFIADTGNNLIRELTFSGYVFLVSGGGSICSTGDTFGNGCSPSGAIFNGPTALQIDSARNIFIADTGNNLVRKITASTNLISIIAGTGQAGFSGNGGTATTAQVSGPTGLAVDAAGNVYIADTGNSAIRLVNIAGTINSVAGTLGASGTGTLPGSAAAVQLTSPMGVVSNGAGRLVVVDSGNNRAFTVDRGSVSYDFGRVNLTFSSPVLQISETSTGSAPASLGTPLFTASGSSTSFSLSATSSAGCTSGQTLTQGSTCLLNGQFTPQALGTVSATYTEANTNTINTPAPFVTLTGTGAVLTTTSSTLVINGTPQYSVPFTVTTTVQPTACNTAAPSCVPTGTVSFYADDVRQGLPIAVSATGTASQTINGLSVGTHVLYAVYSGDAFYAGSTSASVNAVLAQGPTTTVVSASNKAGNQFTDLTLTAQVTGPTSNIPTGSISFYAGSMLLGTSAVGPTTGIATLADIYFVDPKTGAVHNPLSFGLPAGTYALTARYSGDSNYAASTSTAFTLTIAPDPAVFTTQALPPIFGTAQGSTGQSTLTFTPTNTLNGTITFACTGLPANSTCTFQPTTISFSPVSGVPTAQQVQLSIFTDVPSAITASAVRPTFGNGLSGQERSTATALAALAGWPVLLGSLFAMFGFRKQLRAARLLSVLALFGVLAGGSAVLSGCSSSTNSGSSLTPTGTFNVKVVATGPNGTSVTTPLTFTVGVGVPGEE